MTFGHAKTSKPQWVRIFPIMFQVSRHLHLSFCIVSVIAVVLVSVFLLTINKQASVPYTNGFSGQMSASLGSALRGSVDFSSTSMVSNGHGYLSKSLVEVNDVGAVKNASLYGLEIPALPVANLSCAARRLPPAVPVRCDPSLLISETLRMPPFKFLPEFKNPCWREMIRTPLEDLYKTNKFALTSWTYEKAFAKMRDHWTKSRTRPKYRLRCLPYFLLAGQPKCGSTDFYERIITHPDIVTPPSKESHWWGKNRYGWCLNSTESIPLSDYIDLYDSAAVHIESGGEGVRKKKYYRKITSDASVSTLWSNDEWWKSSENCGLLEPRFTNAQYVHAILPQAKIIVIVRNPTERLYSDFLYFHRSSKSPEDFAKAVTEAIETLNSCISSTGLRACVYNSSVASSSKVRLRIGLYHVYLQEWLSLFPGSQVHVVRLEDYASLPLTTIKHVHRFLGLRVLSEQEDMGVIEKPRLNTRRQSDRQLGGMLPKTQQLLDAFYRPYNVALAKLLNDDRFLWEDDRPAPQS
ncbi:unnamed protein product [Lymnaea stagnalis]|uniref:Sulfotransferase domain-containing protein n=1 Tax=Lymnaea stagnalis TaxID=6523 RepID=A0AAV2H8R2_LYMST